MIVKKAIRMLGIAMMLASCNSGDDLQVPNDNVKTITFTASLEENIDSRADANERISRAIVEVYSDAEATQKEHRVVISKGTDGKFTFTIPNMISGKKYTFLFWADNLLAQQFNVSDLKNVKRTHSQILEIAYSLATTLTPEEISQSGVQLKHPLCKISLQTTVALTKEDDIRAHLGSYESFNVLTNSATGNTTTMFWRACNDFNEGDEIRDIYIFGKDETQTISVEYYGRPTRKEFFNVPTKPNTHITLKGDFKSIGL